MCRCGAAGGFYLQQYREHYLHALHICESLYKLRPRIFEAVDAFTEEEVRRHINRHAIKEILEVNGLPRLRELVYHGGCPPLEDVQVTDAILDKHGPDKVSAFMPLLVVGCEDRVSKKSMLQGSARASLEESKSLSRRTHPNSVELGSFTILGKLSC